MATKKKPTKPTTADALIKAKKARTTEFWFNLDDGVAETMRVAEFQLAEANKELEVMSGRERLAAAQRQKEAAEATIADTQAEFDAQRMSVTLEALPHGEWTALVRANQPTAEQRREHAEMAKARGLSKRQAEPPSFGPDFGAYALAACCVSIEFTEAQALEFWSGLAEGEATALVSTLIGLNSSLPR